MSKETLCKNIVMDKHRSMLGALGKDGIQTIKDAVSIEHTKAGKNMAPIVQSLAQFVVDHCKDLTLEGKYILPRDDDGTLGTKAYNEVGGFLVTLMMVFKSYNKAALTLVGSESRLKHHRERPIAMNPISPGTNRSVVSGRANLKLEDLGPKNVKALTHASKCSQARVIEPAFLRAKELLADPRVVKKLKAKEAADVHATRLTYYDQYAAAVEAIAKVCGLSGKDAAEILASFDIIVDTDGRVYYLGALTQQSAKGIQVLTGLINPTILETDDADRDREVLNRIKVFWEKELKMNFDDRAAITAVTDQSIVDWFLADGCLKVYEHCHCAKASWTTGEYYYPIELDMTQSVGQIAALLHGGLEDLKNVGLIPDSNGSYTDAWKSQDKVMLQHAPKNVLSTSALDFEGRKGAKKGTTTVKSYGAGLATCIVAFASIPEKYRKIDDVPEDLTLNELLSECESDTGRRNCQLILDAAATAANVNIDTAIEFLRHVLDLVEDIELSIHTANKATPVINGGLCEAAKNAVDSDITQEWVDYTGFPGRVKSFRVFDDKHLLPSKRNKVYGTPCFPPLDEDGNIVEDQWFEKDRRRKALRLLPMSENTSPMSFAPCFFQGAMESAVLRLVLWILSRLLPNAYFSSRHDCVIVGAEHMDLVEKVFIHCLYTVSYHTDISKMFDHLDIPSEVNVQHWDSKGNVVTTSMALQDPDRLANLKQAKLVMKPFGV